MCDDCRSETARGPRFPREIAIFTQVGAALHVTGELRDPFRTDAMRERILHAWAASPARFREDANAEEDLVRGGYRDRVIVELAQNAADAAMRAGVPGRLSIRLEHDSLVVSNTGSPLDARGVESLSTLRASAKRGGGDQPTVGRFGVGFAAVLALTDEPLVASTSGAVRWSLNEVRGAVEAIPALRDELRRRQGNLPVLRLPVAAAAAPEPGYDTTVLLPLRDEAAAALARVLVDDADDALLLSLPSLAEIVVEIDGVRRVIAGAGDWHVVRRSGTLDPQLLADRPTEERAVRSWSLAWARPRAGQPVPALVHAPTATDEPLELPALLIASFPLDPSRRHVAPGPLTDFLVTQAAHAYAELAADVDEPLSLVPGRAMAGRLDAALRREIVQAMADTPLLTTASGERVRPRDAVAVIEADTPLRDVLADVIGELVADHRALDRLGVTRLPLVDVIDMLGEVQRPPTWWGSVYDALHGLVSTAGVEALGALPVPLVGGRMVRGARGLLLPGEPLPEGVAALGPRIVHPEAAHPLLLRLGAVEASARSVLQDPSVRAAVELAADVPERADVSEAVLSLVERAGIQPGELPWLADVLLADSDGKLVPAGDLVLPGSVVAEVVAPDVLGVPHDAVLRRWPPGVLAAAGVLSSFGLVRDEDVSFDFLGSHDLPQEEEWVEHVLSTLPPQDLPPLLTELVAVTDLDVVRSDAWRRVLAEIATNPDLRAPVVEPARVLLADGTSVDVTSYTGWWLRENAQIHGRPLTSYALPSADDLRGLYEILDPVGSDTPLDEALLAAAGVRTSVEALLSETGGPDELLRRLAAAESTVTENQLLRLYCALSVLDPARVTPPERVRVRANEVVAASDVVIVDEPHHLQLRWPVSPLAVPLSAAAGLADVLDVATTSDRLSGEAVKGGRERPMPAWLTQWLPGAPARWLEHDLLVVENQEVEWWVDQDGSPHAATLEGLARAVAWSSRRWEARLAVAAALAVPERVAELLAEAALEG